MEWAELIKIVGAFIGFAASIIAAFIGGYYLSKVELTKSKLKKAEILFDLRVVAVKKFNEIYQKHDPLNLGKLHNGDVYEKTNWSGMLNDILKYQAEYGYVFESNEIDDKIKKILSSIAEGSSSEQPQFEQDYYKETLILMSEANEMMRKYLFDETKW
ncbi:hypothetical protein [uncultured Campylobacter sp.]|uniref:hypothetical protein n=1 Tax=uncultured Campylobacter sp. TaxID=218934 RepID=UPI0028EB4145|nr:hypothetical protein [uncultured Campylobacter sp.]